ncbi:SDR family NAD(P)-dependent oxidoreductase [Litoreibacter roseus]|uniref:Short-chain dehydrogenase n=1 Tax=Litoreibacter roseus TaxID=2601869 RepID=A0A6N6JK43_9RHOB|nr:SDR family oxidoreductase [Litoreibacter roseus]GFE66691.1 short-chain dehydrogenase [Litoreibacter roseus]
MTQTFTLITGASEGIGKELAKCAAKDGRNVILSARSEDKLNALADELKGTYEIEAVVIPADLSKPEEADALWTKATDGRVIDRLVNNAGLGSNGPFAENDWDRELAMINVNMVSLTLLMKRAVQDMVERDDGKILNVASTAAFIPGPKMAIYHATKAYVLYLSEAVAEELEDTDVSVTALCPGATRTDFFDGADMKNVRLVNMNMMAPAKDVAEAGWAAMRARRRIEVPGGMNKFFAFLPRIMPRFGVTKLVKQFYARN